MQDLLTTQQAADVLQVHHRTLRRWANEGKIECVRLGDSVKAQMRFTREALERFLQGNR